MIFIQNLEILTCSFDPPRKVGRNAYLCYPNPVADSFLHLPASAPRRAPGSEDPDDPPVTLKVKVSY